MSSIHDQQYLLREQYRDASNLRDRASLHARFSTNAYGFMRWVFDHYQLPATAAVLEVGCGAGWLWRENIARVPAGWTVTLSDFSDGMLEEARRNLADNGRLFAFARCDAQTIPYADATFDAVIANHMLYHVPDRARALAEIRRVLRPGGRLFAVTNGVRHMAELHELVDSFDLPIPLREPLPFSLENGRDQLLAHFSHVTVDRYDDALLITEAAPLTAHVLSGWGAASLTAAQRQDFARRMEEHLAAHGPLGIGKDTGLFEAW